MFDSPVCHRQPTVRFRTAAVKQKVGGSMPAPTALDNLLKKRASVIRRNSA
jgi:hypothetical protein